MALAHGAHLEISGHTPPWLITSTFAQIFHQIFRIAVGPLHETFMNSPSLSEHSIEARHAPVGRFLDVRGSVADELITADLFPFWEIKDNVVRLRDGRNQVIKRGAFVGFKSLGLFSYQPDSRTTATEEFSLFWNVLNNSDLYKIPVPHRLGCRSKIFLKSAEPFEDLAARISSLLLSPNALKSLTPSATDFKIVVDYTDGLFSTILTIGPLHIGEASQHFSFYDEAFSSTGIFVDLDVSRTASLTLEGVPETVSEAFKVSWTKADQITKFLLP